MFRIHTLPAAHGDCLLVEYGSAQQVHRMLIDGGVARTYDILRAELAAIPDKQRSLELLVITHVDADHIEGIVKLLSDKSLSIDIREAWFNGYGQLNDAGPLDFGSVQGEYVSVLLEERRIAWNKAVSGGAIHVPDDGPLPAITLPGGLRLTILSPTRKKMATMASVWESEVKKAGLVPGESKEVMDHLETKGKRLLVSFSSDDAAPNIDELVAEAYERDKAPANGSSIAFLAEFGDKRVLFGADAHAEVLVGSLQRLLKERKLKKLPVDIFKLPHHGSAANLSPKLLSLVSAQQFLVSTSGAIFAHPDAPAIARIIQKKRPVELVFNYRSEETEIWDNKSLQKQYAYTTRYPKENGQIMLLDVETPTHNDP